ncbi:MAG: hypothetical protein ACM359_05395, partial [Bacillota bacterium]
MSASYHRGFSPLLTRAVGHVVCQLRERTRWLIHGDDARQELPYRVERLESRTLLSDASTFPGLANSNPIDAAPILTGIANLRTALTHLNGAGSFATSMDLIGGKLGVKADPKSVLNAKILTLTEGYLTGATSPTLQGWATYLEDQSGGAVSLSSFPDVPVGTNDLAFTVHMSKTVDLAARTFNLKSLLQAGGMDTLGYDLSSIPSLTTSVQGDIEVDLTLGYNSSGGSGFYITPGAMTVATGFAASAPVSLNVGMFSFVTGALSAAGPKFTVAWNDPNHNGRIASTELAAAGAGMFGVTTDTSAVSVTIPLELSADTLALNSHIDLVTTAANAFSSPSFVISTASIADLIKTSSLTPLSLASGLSRLSQAFKGMQNLPMMQSSLPLVSNKKVADVLDFAGAIADGMNKTLVSTDSEGAVTVLFSNFDDLLAKLHSYCSNVNYDAATRELSFTVDYTYSFTALDLPLNFNVDLSPFSLSTTSHLQAGGSVDMSFTFGVQIAPDEQLQTIAEADNAPTADPNATIKNGRLGSDVQFEVYLDGWQHYTVPLTAASTSANNNLLDLAASLNAALAGAGLGGKVEAFLMDPITLGGEVNAGNFNTAGYDQTGRIGFRTVTPGQYFAIRVVSNAGAESQLGFLASQHATPVAALFFIDNAHLGGNVDLTASGIAADASIGIVSVGVSNGVANITGSASADVVNPENSSHRITLPDLQRLGNHWKDMIALNLAGSGAVLFDQFNVMGISGASLGANPWLKITIPDIA